MTKGIFKYSEDCLAKSILLDIMDNINLCLIVSYSRLIVYNIHYAGQCSSHSVCNLLVWLLWNLKAEVSCCDFRISTLHTCEQIGQCKHNQEMCEEDFIWRMFS